MQASIDDEAAEGAGATRKRGGATAPDLTTSLYAVVAYFSKEATVGLFDTVDALEMTVTQIRVLHHLDEIDRELSVKEAAEFAVMSVGAISRALDGLVRREFVQRREDGADRRMKRVRITDHGRTAIRRFEAVNKGVIDRFVETLPVAERDRLAMALAFLVERPEIAACLPPAAE
jgi:DNA-binding MarR family transcriptional regulator